MTSDLDIRRPDLMGFRREGTVRWFTDEKGYGRIAADDGEVLWFHHSEIQVDGYRTATAGQRVAFVWRGHTAAHGRHAAESVQPYRAGALRARDHAARHHASTSNEDSEASNRSRVSTNSI
jgi:cold shock protein